MNYMYILYILELDPLRFSMSNNPRPHPATNVPLISSALCPAIPQGSATLQLFPEQVPGILELSHPNLSKASSKVHRKHHSPGQPS